jgi:hypothetical protein
MATNSLRLFSESREYREVLVSGVCPVTSITDVRHYSHATCLRDKTALSPGLFAYAGNQPVANLDLTEILSIGAIDLIIMKTTNMLAVMSPEIVSIAVPEKCATPGP